MNDARTRYQLRNYTRGKSNAVVLLKKPFENRQNRNAQGRTDLEFRRFFRSFVFCDGNRTGFSGGVRGEKSRRKSGRSEFLQTGRVTMNLIDS